uniref:Neurotrypsin n=1 Tax=Romanomermis culicivorax TaxID=13658 RepID=A0A915IS72_ROMCU
MCHNKLIIIYQFYFFAEAIAVVYYGADDHAMSYQSTVDRAGYSSQIVRLRGYNREVGSGRIEIYTNGTGWGLMCRNNFDINAGHVICRQLGFERGAKQIVSGLHYGSGHLDHFALNNVNCRGDETNILMCEKPSTVDCEFSSESMGLRCTPNYASKCDPGGVLYENTCYYFIRNHRRNFHEALKYCTSDGKHLVNIYSQQINDFLSEVAASLPDAGKDYDGSANVSVLGQACLHWNDQRIPESIKKKISLSHNYCRNLDGDTSPWCFILNDNDKVQKSMCDLPLCSVSFCATGFVQCGSTKKCIHKEFVCDYQKDCPNGYDEADCPNWLEKFMKVHQRRLHKVWELQSEVWNHVLHPQVHTSPCRWENEADHYDGGGNDTGTRRQRGKGQPAQMGACGGRTSRAVLLRGLSISCTCAGETSTKKEHEKRD